MCPTVVETCLDLLRWGKFISGFLLTCRVGLERWGGGVMVLEYSRGDGLKKIFNRSPITLKFEAEKLERESQARERERERERARVRSKASELSFYSCKLLFYLRKLAFYPCNLLFYL